MCREVLHLLEGWAEVPPAPSPAHSPQLPPTGSAAPHAPLATAWSRQCREKQPLREGPLCALPTLGLFSPGSLLNLIGCTSGRTPMGAYCTQHIT